MYFQIYMEGKNEKKKKAFLEFSNETLPPRLNGSHNPPDKCTIEGNREQI